MICEIKNKLLSVKIDSCGAELVSVSSLKDDTEFIWQGDKKYWGGHSPIIFPFCGRLFESRYTYRGTSYEMTKHGFVRGKQFNVLTRTENKVEFVYSENSETLKIYPFAFDLIIGFELCDECLNITYKVINKDDKDMYFSYGAHPAFNVPFVKNSKFEDYYLTFTKNSYMKREFNNDVLYTGKDIDFNLLNKRLDLKHNLFDNDAIFLDDSEDEVTLCCSKSANYIKVNYSNMTTLGLWHSCKTDAPFLCIEPTCGFPGREGIVEDLETKLEMIKLSSKKTYANSYSIKFHIE